MEHHRPAASPHTPRVRGRLAATRTDHFNNILHSNVLYELILDTNRHLSVCGTCTEEPICHPLPEPDALTPAQWETVLQTMQKRMRQFGMTELNEEEFAAVLAYLSAAAAPAP